MDLSVKLPEPIVEPSAPWDDDRLDRKKMAGKLAELIRSQSEPFTVSITGNWGTGKTFFLKRWQHDLRNDGACVVYFNAWENDCYDDPLVVIIDQLNDIAKENDLQSIFEDVKKNVKAWVSLNIDSLVRKSTGIQLLLPESHQKVEYTNRKNTKVDVKKSLASLSEQLKEKQSGGNRQYPLVFIIDELDRCRPLFAIELLERIKHILDVIDIVFVFGINRIELSKSVQSIYGEIDSDSYLMRFFDMEFVLPCPDMNAFCGHLYTKYGLSKRQIALRGRGVQWDIFPIICSTMGLSLRDVEHCIRTVKFAIATKQWVSVPALLLILTVLKVKNRIIYQEFLQGECSGADVMNYINKSRSPNIRNISTRSVDCVFDIIELLLYAAHSYAIHRARRMEDIIPFQQLDMLVNESDDRDQLTHPETLANATIRAGKERIKTMIRMKNDLFEKDEYGEIILHDSTLEEMFELIELTNLPSSHY